MLDEKIELNIAPIEKHTKTWLIFLIFGIVGFIGGIACVLLGIFLPKEEPAALAFPSLPSEQPETVTYSKLTGEKLADPSIVNSPTYCVQVPNGTDGARPQSGLTEAGVIFEAIAEAGITRFAAIFQNPGSAVIGPIRSLRIYYLEWDTPFNCTIVHAGGADDAIAALRDGGYRDLTENYAYMYRGTYGVRRWNNLFTTGSYLRQFNEDRGYDNSEIIGFARMTPEESKKQRVDSLVQAKLNITESTDKNTSTMTPKVSAAEFRFGNIGSFNVSYIYDTASNTYLRRYGNDTNHEVYECSKEDQGEPNPEDNCNLTQMHPSVVIAMVVEERKAADNYHEDITAIGSGEAYIFQNGMAIKGTWNKSSWEAQIEFFDSDGNKVLLAPGQTIISAIPTYGAVEY